LIETKFKAVKGPDLYGVGLLNMVVEEKTGGSDNHITKMDKKMNLLKVGILKPRRFI
jgi:hypothetical protein